MDTVAVLSEQSSTITAAFQTVATSLVDTIGALAPVGLTVCGVIIAWRYGKKFFTNFAK